VPDITGGAPAATDTSRIPLLRTAQADPRAREVFASAHDQYGAIANLYRALANSPELLRAWAELAWPLRTRLEVPRSLAEVAILRIARALRAEYVWAHHYEFALRAGVSEATLALLDSAAPWQLFDGPVRGAVRAADEMTLLATVSDDCYAELSDDLPAAQVLELLATIAFYHCVARLTGALRIPLEAGPNWKQLP
jgi:alkylhydroperoxidase family enzyme